MIVRLKKRWWQCRRKSQLRLSRAGDKASSVMTMSSSTRPKVGLQQSLWLTRLNPDCFMIGYPKDHPLIDFLRLRTIAVSKTFTDEEVQSA